MKERPIMFSAPMVRAILEGRKTQTRRIVKKMPHYDLPTNRWLVPLGKSGYQCHTEREAMALMPICCPYGQPGAWLWVRETFQYYNWDSDGTPCIRYASGNDIEWKNVFDLIQLDKVADIWEALSHPNNFNIDNRACDRKWRPSIHMPRWASRITLEIVSVRVERLREISKQDAIAEGVERTVTGDGWRRYCNDPEQEAAGLTPCATAAQSFRSLWESLNGPGSWSANTWVWVVEFRRVA